MNIKTIDIKYFQTNGFYSECEGKTHIKTLSFLSVVQSVEGSYDVMLGGGSKFQTGDGGAFIAPSQVVQDLTHHVNKDSGFMRSHWIFLDVLVNGVYPLDSLFEFPTLLPPEYQSRVYSIINNIDKGHDLCPQLSEVYKLVDILIKIGKPVRLPDRMTNEIILYIRTHIDERISYSDLAEHLNISQSSLFRKFRTEFGSTPANYINKFRVWYAAAILEAKPIPIKELALAAGFCDEFYFSKIFKKVTGLSPSDYKKKIIKTDSL